MGLDKSLFIKHTVQRYTWASCQTFATLHPGSLVYSQQSYCALQTLPKDPQSQKSTKVYNSLQSKQQHPHIIPKYSGPNSCSYFSWTSSTSLFLLLFYSPLPLLLTIKKSLCHSMQAMDIVKILKTTQAPETKHN